MTQGGRACSSHAAQGRKRHERAQWQTRSAARAGTRRSSPRALDRQPALAALLEAGDGEEALEVGKRRRAARPMCRRRCGANGWRWPLRSAIGDLAGAFPLARVMSELSRDSPTARSMPRSPTRSATACPMPSPPGSPRSRSGKHGAGELNYSSDIDPILLYDPDCCRAATRDEPGEAAQRVAQRVVETPGHAGPAKAMCSGSTCGCARRPK